MFGFFFFLFFFFLNPKEEKKCEKKKKKKKKKKCRTAPDNMREDACTSLTTLIQRALDNNR